MERAYVETVILPFFAKACADALKDPLDNMLKQQMKAGEIYEFAEGAGRLYAKAYARMRDSFLSSHDLVSSPTPSSAQPDAHGSSQEAATQGTEEELYQLLQQLMKTQMSMLERIDRLSGH